MSGTNMNMTVDTNNIVKLPSVTALKVAALWYTRRGQVTKGRIGLVPQDDFSLVFAGDKGAAATLSDVVSDAAQTYYVAGLAISKETPTLIAHMIDDFDAADNEQVVRLVGMMGAED